ncbi:MAG: hypothetical protein JWQ14_1825 [Adhaeribacter sp.]|nr:hypothetical protein [Adhaeribacter sp.]
MKKSNIFLLVAVIILLASLVSYNTTLKAEYLSGAHRDPYRHFNTFNLKGFDEIAINTNNGVNVKIQQGSHQARILKRETENIKFKQVGKLLMVEINYPEDRNNYYGPEQVVITMPILKALRADTTPREVKKPKDQEWVTNTAWSTIKITGFTQDSLFINQDKMTTVEMTANKLAYLHAITGQNPGSASSLHLDKNNTIARAILDIRNNSELTLKNIFIPQLTYQFSDSAKVNFSGAALAILKK